MTTSDRCGTGGRATRLAWALLVVALGSGCAGLRRQVPVATGLSADDHAAAATPAPAPPRSPAVAAAPPSLREALEEHVAAQMATQPAAVQREVVNSVLAESERARIDPSIVLAVIHVESRFNPRAHSRAGAKGLMQLRKPAIREELGRAEARRANAFDPATNVRVGTSYLRRLIDSFGKLETALMAYNAGPSRVRALLERGRSIPAALRRYPRQVMEELERVRLALGIRPPEAEQQVVASRP